MKQITIALGLILTSFFTLAQNECDLVNKYMKEQENAWNEADLEGFMLHYWKSDSLVFIGKSGVNYGWQKTLDNYIVSYPNPEKMGQLEFTNKIVRKIDSATIQVIGKWHLSRNEELGDLEGHYSLVWKIKDNRWVIISDHSS